MKIRFFIILALVVIIVSIFFGGYFYLWQYQVSPLIDRFSATQINIQALNDEGENYSKRIEPDLKKYADEFKKISSLFFKPDPLLNYIIFIETLAKRNDLKHTIAVPPTAVTGSSQITVSGQFKNIMQFLREIENDSILIRVQSVTLQVGGGGMSAVISIKLQSL